MHLNINVTCEISYSLKKLIGKYGTQEQFTVAEQNVNTEFLLRLVLQAVYIKVGGDWQQVDRVIFNEIGIEVLLIQWFIMGMITYFDVVGRGSCQVYSGVSCCH